MNRSSFFKLPLIFIAIHALIAISWYLGNSLLRDNTSSYIDIFPYMLTAQLIAMFFPLCLFFIIATFQCQKYRLHTTDNQNLINIIIIAVIFSVFGIGWGYLVSFVLQPVYDALRELDGPTTLYFSLLNYARMIISYVVRAFILLLLFKLVAGNNIAQRQPYLFDMVSGRKVYATVFSLALFTLGALWTSLTIFGTMFDLYFNLGESTAIYFILPTVILTSLFNYWFIYASTLNSFHSVPSTLKIIPLVKSIALTVLFIILASIALGIVLGLVAVGLFSSSRFYYSIPPSFIIFAIFAIALIYWLVFLVTRLAVRIIFKQTINDQSTTPPTSTILESIL